MFHKLAIITMGMIASLHQMPTVDFRPTTELLIHSAQIMQRETERADQQQQEVISFLETGELK